MQDLYRPSLSMLYRILRYSSGETADGNPGTDPGMGTDRGQTRPSTRCKKRTLGQGRSVPGCNGSRYSRTPDHTGGGVQVTLFSPSRKRLQSGPERSRARPRGAAKRTLDGEDRFEMIEKGETARGIPATSVTKSASIGAIDRDPLQKETEGRAGKNAGEPAHTREAKLGCVFIQTKWDAEGYPIRDPDSTTYTGAIEPAEEFGKRLYLEAWNRGWSRAEKKVA